MKCYLILTAIFLVQISACSVMNKKIQKSTESAAKKETIKKDSVAFNLTDSMFKASDFLKNVTHSVVTNDVKTDENIIEWIFVGPDSSGVITAVHRDNLLNWKGTPITGTVIVRKTNRISYDKGSSQVTSNLEMSHLDTSSKLTKSAISLNQVNQSDSAGVNQTFNKDVDRKKFLAGWWIIMILVIIAFFTRRYWLPEIARLFS